MSGKTTATVDPIAAPRFANKAESVKQSHPRRDLLSTRVALWSDVPCRSGSCSTVMTDKRRRLWDTDKRREYWQSKETAARRAADRKQGATTAQALDAVWRELTADERSLMEYLLLSARRSVVALYEDELFKTLAAKGLLQVPPGVGTILMRKLETTFTVPSAVWKVLNERRQHFLPYTEDESARRLTELAGLMGPKIQV